MQGSRSKESKGREETMYISANDFESYLVTLPAEQRKELRDFLNHHPQVDSKNKGNEKIYKGPSSVLQEVQYLINLTNHRNPEAISEQCSESFVSVAEPKFVTERIPNLVFTKENFVEIAKSVATLKRIERGPLQMVVRGRNQLSSEGEIYISNRCRGEKKLFFIFEHFHELLQLQALLDMEWRLETILPFWRKFEEEGIKLLKNAYNNYEIYFFQRVGPSCWNKFIASINKQPPASYLILIKSSLFPQIYANRKKFISGIRLVMPEISLPPELIVTQLKTFPPDVEFTPVQELALAVLRNDEREYCLQGQVLDCVTSLYCVIMQERGAKEMLVMRPDEANTKNYVFFTFYGKLMEVVREGEVVVLVQRNIKEEITSTVYRSSLEDILKEAAINQCPFFYFCQIARQVSKVPITECQKLKSQDINRFLYYRYLLNLKHYRASAVNTCDIEQIVQRHESPFLMKFQSEKVVSKMGKTKSEEVLKRYREGAKGCFLAKATFCRSFFDTLKQLIPLK